MNPTLAGFTAWVYTAVGIPSAALPTDSVWLEYAFNAAMEIVNITIQIASPSIYTLAVYNLAADNLLNWAQDTPPSTFFVTTREAMKLTSFVAGVVDGAGDQGTNANILNPDFLKELTMGNLQNLKTPYGRQYLAFAQDYGPSVWGLT